MSDQLNIPTALLDKANAPLLTGVLRGLEKESLRIDSDGRLSQSGHPQALGSALTHPHITTDFSEALMEFITAPSHRISQLLQQLSDIHQYSYLHLNDELLWCSSMPCPIENDQDIPIALYGNSNRAQMKSIYRMGLGHRYGRTMQTVAGVHFNYSLPRAFWAFLHSEESSVEDLNDYISSRYFSLIRNFRRTYWLLIYLFGSSPAVCSSFVKGREHNLQPLDGAPSTLYMPYATSLRMGDLGYQSSAQESLKICYNNMPNYVRTLCSAISTPYDAYAGIGSHDNHGQRIQLNTHLLQIENEFYGPIRPKRTAQKGETAITALCQRGVEYIEVRCLDLNPFSALGVDRSQLEFLDIFLVHCALSESPPCTGSEPDIITANQKKVVINGRRAGLLLQRPNGESVTMREWGEELFSDFSLVAELLDQAHETDRYSKACASQLAKLRDTALTPSARVLSQLKEQQVPFSTWAKRLSQHHKDTLLNIGLSSTTEQKFDTLSAVSTELQRSEEAEPQPPLEDYLKEYYEQYSQCCNNCT